MTRAILPAQVTPPEFALSAHGPAAIVGVEVIALPVQPGADTGDLVLGPGAAAVEEQTGLDLLAVAEAHRATGEVGEVSTIAVPQGTATNPELRLLALVGVGDASAAAVRRAGAALAKAVKGRTAVAASVPAVAADPAHAIEAFVVGMTLGSFGFHWRSAPPTDVPVTKVVLALGADVVGDAGTLGRAVALGGAGWRSRMLATVPSNLKNPAWLAEQAEELATTAGLECRIWDEKDLARGGFGGILAVGQASATPPRLIRLDYTPEGVSSRAAKKLPTVVLVGKGITFDSGGLSLKPAQSMTSMKRDMTGGAVVLATMAALADVDCPVRVIGLVPTAENAVSGTSLRPGDVITHWGGRTTEVNNTDAEGRLVLADALAYAVAELDPTVVVDVATLTGGIKVALGQQVGGLFATDDTLADRLREAGDHAGEPLWRFPLFAGYADKLASKVADADNAPGGPPAITAALFLQPFVGDVPWAHLDIASVGDVEKEWHEWTPGPSGFGPRALLSWLGSEAPVEGIPG